MSTRILSTSTTTVVMRRRRWSSGGSTSIISNHPSTSSLVELIEQGDIAFFVSKSVSSSELDEIHEGQGYIETKLDNPQLKNLATEVQKKTSPKHSLPTSRTLRPSWRIWSSRRVGHPRNVLRSARKLLLQEVWSLWRISCSRKCQLAILDGNGTRPGNPT